jgi:type VI secretion system secreted protein Hcp
MLDMRANLPCGHCSTFTWMKNKTGAGSMIDAFMKIDGIEGESTDQKHTGWIEVLDFDFSIAQKVSRTACSAGGASAERSDFSEFAITKMLDKSSPLLALACAEGRHINSIVIELWRAGKVKYMAYQLAHCLISEVSTHSDGEFPEEEVSIDIGRFEMVYTQQSRSTGQALGQVAGGWDRTRNCRA